MWLLPLENRRLKRDVGEVCRALGEQGGFTYAGRAKLVANSRTKGKLTEAKVGMINKAV